MRKANRCYRRTFVWCWAILPTAVAGVLLDRPEKGSSHRAASSEQEGATAERPAEVELERPERIKTLTWTETELFELRHLAIGRLAPEIEGKDLDGRPLQLSDHRGKVVLLVFSGFSWCGPCRASLVHEQELAERLKGKPYAAVGVYREEDRQWLKDFMSKEVIPWRAWWNDPAAADSISRKWNMHSWPTMYLLDYKGVIGTREMSCGPFG